MLESGDMSEMDTETNPPGEVVATKPEETAQPQGGDTDDVEVYIDEEGDQQEQPKTSMTQAQAYAAWKEEKDKRKRKNEELKKEREERERLEREVRELKDAVGSITKGKPPTMADCDFDEEVFQQKTREYYSSPEAKKEIRDDRQPEQSVQTDDVAEFYLYQKEQELSKALPGYDEAKSKLVEKFRQYGGNDGTVSALAGIARNANVDIAKAIFAMSASDNLVMELNQAVGTGNQFAIAEILNKAAGKVKTRQRKPIDTKPEPDVKSSGPIDNRSKAIQKARQEWVDATGSDKLAKWNAYQALKNQKGE